MPKPTVKEASSVYDYIHGRTALMVFWHYASTQGRKALRSAETLHAMYSDSGLRVVSVHTPVYRFEFDRQNLWKAVSETKWAHRIFHDSSCVLAAELKVTWLPSAIVFDAEGSERLFSPGDPASYEVNLAIRDLLSFRETSGKKGPSLVEQFMERAYKPETGFSPPLRFGDAGVRSKSLQGPRRARIILEEGFRRTEDSVVTGPERCAVMALNYYGREVNLVLAPLGDQVRIEVTLDGGRVPAYILGEDLLIESNRTLVRAHGSDVYRLIDGGWGSHLLELRVNGAVEFYEISFG
ncbi:MAG: hypothetical protein QW767_06840 [Thermoprotei archaeon]